MTAPYFQVTTAGLAARQVASLNGARVTISSFRIGSAFGYEPDPTGGEIGLRGSIQYTGLPASSVIYDEETISIKCILPPSAGPFSFGEIGLYTADNVLFASAAWPIAQYKYQAVVNGSPQEWEFNCMLKFTPGSPAQFNVISTNSVALYEVPHTGYVTAPSLMSGNPNAVIVHEQSPLGNDSFVLVNNTSAASTLHPWTPIKYAYLDSIQFLSVNSNGTVLTSNNSAVLDNLDKTTPKRYAIQTPQGDFRLVQSITLTGTTYNLTLTYPLGTANIGTAARIKIYESDETFTGQNNIPFADFWDMYIRWISLAHVPKGTVYPSEMMGFGQNTHVFSGSNPPTTNDWNILTNLITNLAKLTGQPINSTNLVGMDSRITSSSLTKRIQQLSTLSRVLDYAEANVMKIPATTMQVSFGAGAGNALVDVLRTGYWQTVHHDIDVTFPSEETARGFFHSGGYVGFNLRSSGVNYVQWVQQAIYARLGTLKFGLRVESLGAEKVVFEEGDGAVTSAGTCGYYGLTDTRKLMFQYQIFLGVPPYTTPGNGAVTLQIWATRTSVGAQGYARSMKLELWVIDNSGAPYNNYPTSLGYISAPEGSGIRSTIILGMAPPALLGDPPITKPVVASSPSTIW